MGTKLSEIYDLFMMQVTDYRLIELFNVSETNFENYLQAWLINATVDFAICNQDLDFDEITLEFPVTLTKENKVILATLMTKYWMTKEVSDITQMQLHVGDRDFKVSSEGQNLKEKSNYLITMKEQCSQLLIDYGYRKNNWGDWFNQSFEGG